MGMRALNISVPLAYAVNRKLTASQYQRIVERVTKDKYSDDVAYCLVMMDDGFVIPDAVLPKEVEEMVINNTLPDSIPF